MVEDHRCNPLRWDYPHHNRHLQGRSFKRSVIHDAVWGVASTGSHACSELCALHRATRIYSGITLKGARYQTLPYDPEMWRGNFPTDPVILYGGNSTLPHPITMEYAGEQMPLRSSTSGQKGSLIGIKHFTTCEPLEACPSVQTSTEQTVQKESSVRARRKLQNRIAQRNLRRFLATAKGTEGNYFSLTLEIRYQTTSRTATTTTTTITAATGTAPHGRSTQSPSL